MVHRVRLASILDAIKLRAAPGFRSFLCPPERSRPSRKPQALRPKPIRAFCSDRTPDTDIGSTRSRSTGGKHSRPRALVKLSAASRARSAPPAEWSGPQVRRCGRGFGGAGTTRHRGGPHVGSRTQEHQAVPQRRLGLTAKNKSGGSRAPGLEGLKKAPMKPMRRYATTAHRAFYAIPTKSELTIHGEALCPALVGAPLKPCPCSHIGRHSTPCRTFHPAPPSVSPAL